MRPDAQPPWRPPGVGTSAPPQRGEDRRGLPPRPPVPPPPRRPPPPPPPRAANGRGGERSYAVSTGVEAEGAGAGDTRRGGARRLAGAAGRNEDAVAKLGALEVAGSAEAREERVSDGKGRKSLLPPSVQPPPKRRAVCEESRAPPSWCKDLAIPLGRKRDAVSSSTRLSALADGGSGAREKAPPRPPPAGSKNAELFGDARPRAPGMNVLNKFSAAGDARPVTGGGHHDADARVVKPSEALHPSTVTAADGLPVTGSHGAAGHTAKDRRRRGAGTDELQMNESVPATRLSSKLQMFSAETLRRSVSSCRSDAGSVPCRGSRDTDKLTSDRVMDKRPIAQNNKVATNRVSSGPKKKGEVKAPDYPPIRVVNALGNNEKSDSKVAFYLKDDDVLKAVAICDGEIELYIRNSSYYPSGRRQIQHGVHNADARSKLKMICRRFEFICRVLVRAVEQHSLNLNGCRIDLVADRVMKELPGFSKLGPVEGKVPGVEVGDEFLYRVQLAIVGLHRSFQAGIDWTKNRYGTPVAVSIVCSGGYPDELLGLDKLMYTGSGGELAGKKDDVNQKLNGGNLALRNCIHTKTPVRVIYGYKSDNVEEHSHSMAKKIPTFTYGGLYRVVDFGEESNPGPRVFRYTLEKIPGQPKLPMYVAKKMKESQMGRGLRKLDISEGKEGTPICVINRVDDVLPAPFKYITRIEYAPCPTNVRPKGCGCTNGCSDSDSCSCARKNGGKFPFNFNGDIVCESPFIFECGPSCKCPPSCHNRVGQHGIKIPLEVFRTSKTGWGVRSLRSISSGSFVCEYVGELRQSIEADQKKKSRYLFNIGRSKGSQPGVSELNSSGTCSGAMDDVGFTIDATEYGNVGRFINHSCSPNLFAQNVLFDHGDKRMPHIMFFAAETIPPLQKLTCEYK